MVSTIASANPSPNVPNSVTTNVGQETMVGVTKLQKDLLMSAFAESQCIQNMDRRQYPNLRMTLSYNKKNENK